MVMPGARQWADALDPPPTEAWGGRSSRPSCALYRRKTLPSSSLASLAPHPYRDPRYASYVDPRRQLSPVATATKDDCQHQPPSPSAAASAGTPPATCDPTRTTQQKKRDNNLIDSKDWSEIGVAVYRVGVGMYHSSVAVDNVEWHYWEGLGVQALPRYYDGVQRAVVSVNHVPFVAYVPIDTILLPPRRVATYCRELAEMEFSVHTYDLLRCNCNHFTEAVLQRLGLRARMPVWVNRLANTTDTLCSLLPFVRTWVDTILNRNKSGTTPRLAFDALTSTSSGGAVFSDTTSMISRRLIQQQQLPETISNRDGASSSYPKGRRAVAIQSGGSAPRPLLAVYER